MATIRQATEALSGNAAEAYVPDLPEESWLRIRGFVVGVVQDTEARLPYPTSAILNAVAHHVDWCVNLAGLPLTTDALFRRDVIAAAVAVMPTRQSSTQGRRRSLLLRVGETLGIIPLPPPLPALAAASPSAPYTELEVDLIVQWAATQGSQDLASARALVGLGLGAGLPTRDLVAVRATDIEDDGALVTVSERSVPVMDRWAEELAAVARAAEDRTAPLFRPGAAWSKNIVTVFVDRSVNAGMRPSTQRMRATWLVHHLAVGTPMQDLLNAAGLASMDALVRYERFLPPASAVAHAGMPR